MAERQRPLPAADMAPAARPPDDADRRGAAGTRGGAAALPASTRAGAAALPGGTRAGAAALLAGLAVAGWAVPAAVLDIGAIGPIRTAASQAMLLAVWAAALLAAYRWLPLGPLPAAPGPRRLGTCAAAGLLAASLVLFLTALVTLQAFPNSGDEYVMLFQADTLAAGRLWNPQPPVPDAFRFIYGVLQDGKWVGQYPPGWPAVLAATGALGIPAWTVAPLLGAASLVVFWHVCRRLASPGLALATTAFLGASPFFLFNAASFFNHQLVLLAAVVFAWCALRFLDDRADWRSALGAGLALGVVGVTRHLEAAMLALPFAAAILWPGPARGSRLSAVWIGVGGLPFLALLMLYYDGITGSPLMPTMQWHNPNDTIRFLAADPEAHETSRSAWLSWVRVLDWSQWTSPAVVLLYAGAFLLKAAKRELRFFDFYLPLFMVGYFFYWGDAGNRYGPRYVHAALPFLFLTMMTAYPLAMASLSGERLRRTLAFAAAGAAAVMVGQLVFWQVQTHRVILERLDLYHRVEAAGLENAVVLLGSSTGLRRHMPPEDLARNGIEPLGRPVLYLRDLGERNAEAMAAFPERTFWLYTREWTEAEGRLEPYVPGADRGG